MTLGERIRSIRKNRELTLENFSELCGVSVPYLSDIERDAVNPSLRVVFVIARAFELTASQMLEVVDEAGLPENITDFQKHLDDMQLMYLGIDSQQIDMEWIALLAKIQYKGRRPKTPREWLEVFMFLQRLLAPEEIE